MPSPIGSAPSSHRGQMLGPPCGPPLAEPVMVLRDGKSAVSSHLANFSEKGPLFQGMGNNLAPPYLCPLYGILHAFPRGS